MNETNELKLLLILCASGRADEVRRLIEQRRVEGFTEIPELEGAGVTGRHLGSRAFPGTTSLIFTALAPEPAAALVAALAELQKRCDPGEGLRVFALDAAAML
ncbi:MAG: hypothetical protein D6696_11135 [Acidobacteria bacterium]|nr:MAG: hypothetical protein D6696_11135 [Acidobacteriota bacterium]